MRACDSTVSITFFAGRLCVEGKLPFRLFSALLDVVCDGKRKVTKTFAVWLLRKVS